MEELLTEEDLGILNVAVHDLSLKRSKLLRKEDDEDYPIGVAECEEGDQKKAPHLESLWGRAS
jgi:hypothetical protein